MKKNSKQEESNETLKIIGGILLGSLFVYGIFHFISGGDNGLPTTNSPKENPSQEVIIVEGVQEVTLSWGKFNYAPEVITVKKDMPVRIKADLHRLDGCYRSLEIPAFGISKAFTERDDTLEFTPTKTGAFKFSCSMGMGSGTLQVT